VVYDARGFLEKNRDRLASEVIVLLRTSRLEFLRSLFNSATTKLGSPGSFAVIDLVVMANVKI